jgi:hypothetical protein
MKRARAMYSKADGRLDGVMVIKNHGPVAANDIDLESNSVEPILLNR